MSLFPTKTQWANWKLPSKASYIGMWVGILALIVAIILFFLSNIPPQSKLSGILTPDDKTTPSNACGDIPSNALSLFFGNSVAYTNTFPHTVIEVKDEQLLVINKEKEKITISAKFFSRDGKIVAQLKDNTFYINPNNYFRIERPNDHKLILYDQETTQILNVEYMNPSVIKLLGTFYLPNRPPLIIGEDWQTFGGLKMSGNCFGNNRVDIHLE